jgi:hypothetical protein
MGIKNSLKMGNSRESLIIQLNHRISAINKKKKMNPVGLTSGLVPTTRPVIVDANPKIIKTIGRRNNVILRP